MDHFFLRTLVLTVCVSAPTLVLGGCGGSALSSGDGSTPASGGTSAFGGATALGGTTSTGGSSSANAAGGSSAASSGGVSTSAGSSSAGAFGGSDPLNSLGGSAVATGGATSNTDGRSSAPAGAIGGAAASYTCTLMIGILATEEWYDFGFKKIVDNSKWELMFVHSGFVELWADPKDPVWSTAIMSPCAQNAQKPDRIVFLALNFDFTTLAEWLPPVTASVQNLQAKYPSAKRIELMSFIRAPGNKACSQAPAKRSTITPAQDDAMAMVAAANPGLVFVDPKFEAKSCSEFSDNPPHPSPAGVTAWSTLMGNYFK